jgi:HlyD family secretion protein
MKKWIPRLVGLVLFFGAAAFVVLWWKPWEKAVPEISFNTVAVGRGSIAAQVTANGTLSARGTVLVGAQVSGRVLELKADFNDEVKKGQIIAKLDESVLRAQIDQAQAAYDLAVANQRRSNVTLVDAKRQLERQRTLKEQQLVAGVALEQAEVAHDQAVASLSASKAQVNQAMANLQQAKTNLTFATITSPVDGVVLSRSVELGQTVQSSMTAPTLFTIAEDLVKMQINTAVAEADVGQLNESMKAQFTVDAFPGKTFEGVVRQVRNAPTTTSGVVTYDAVIDVENPEKMLRPGMTASVTFVLAHVADTVKIPNSALRFKPSREQMAALREQLGMEGRGSGMRGSGGGSGGPRRGGGERGSGAPGGEGRRGRDFGDKKPVYKLVDGKPQMVLIKPGLTDGSSTQMVEGDLQPGDQLIIEITGVPTAPRRPTGGF